MAFMPFRVAGVQYRWIPGTTMRFNFFSARQPGAIAPARPVFDAREADTERAALAVALHSLLETLPQSYSGRENIKLLCHTILGATPHLRFVWVGFCEGDAAHVEPYAAAGDCAQECADWRLSSSCFDPSGPYSQAFPENVESPGDLDPLFAPWRKDWSAASVNCALAIPLRSENRGLRGMIVFYADSIDYFTYMNVPLFQAFCHVAEIIWKQSNLRHMLTQKAQQDPLTGLMNRRYTMQVLEKEIASAEQANEPLSILICRVEGFNKLNDLYGWVASDAILAAFSKDAGLQMRTEDKGGRWTGTEFLYILPLTTTEEAELLARKLREYFLVHSVNVKNWSVRLALTVGVATYSKQIIGLDDFILHANQNMLSSVDELPSSMF
jgi:diguanylate cyclase (GGDEF)-like protein